MKRRRHPDHETCGRRARRGRGGEDGFTLVEVVVVLVLLGVLGVGVMARSRGVPAAVAAEAGVLRGHLRFAQGMAMANNTAVWSMQLNATSYVLLRDGEPSPINLPDEPAPGRTLGEGVRIVEGVGRVTFSEWGDPGGDVRITLSAGHQRRSIDIFGFTGLMP